MKLQNLIFPHCWVCGVRFVDQIPPGPACEERHHLFPQAAGGTDGPVVSLCDSHHTKAHKLAYAHKGMRIQQTQNLLIGCTTEQAKKLLWIASLIVKAEALTVNDGNKPIKVFLVLDSRQAFRAKQLKQLLGAKTLAEVFQTAIDKLHNSYKDQL